MLFKAIQNQNTWNMLEILPWSSVTDEVAVIVKVRHLSWQKHNFFNFEEKIEEYHGPIKMHIKIKKCCSIKFKYITLTQKKNELDNTNHCGRTSNDHKTHYIKATWPLRNEDTSHIYSLHYSLVVIYTKVPLAHNTKS